PAAYPLFPYTTLFRSQFEAGERVLQAPALLPANQPVGRDFVIRKDQLGRVEPLIAELFELFADREPRPLLGQEEAHAAVARIGGDRKSTRLNSSHLGI